MSLDEMVAAHDVQLVVLGVKVARISMALGIADAALPPVVCPGCGKPVPPNGDGSLPPHQIDGAVLAPGRRRSASVCMRQPEPSTVASTVSTVGVVR